MSEIHAEEKEKLKFLVPKTESDFKAESEAVRRKIDDKLLSSKNSVDVAASTVKKGASDVDRLHGKKQRLKDVHEKTDNFGHGRAVTGTPGTAAVAGDVAGSDKQGNVEKSKKGESKMNGHSDVASLKEKIR